MVSLHTQKQLLRFRRAGSECGPTPKMKWISTQQYPKEHGMDQGAKDTFP